MVDEAKKTKLHAVVTPADATDFESLWLDSGLGAACKRTSAIAIFSTLCATPN